MRFDDVEVEICDRCGECFSWHGEVNGIRKVKIKERGYECSPDRSFVLCPSCMVKLNDWLTPDEQKPDTGNKNEWNSMNVQPQCGEAVEIKFENGDLDIAYRRYNDKRWFQSSGEWVLSDVKIVAWRYID